MAAVETEICEPREGLERGVFVRFGASSAGGPRLETGPSPPGNGGSDGRTVDARLVDSETTSVRETGCFVRDLP
ncbi:hypothetical protein [Haloterrigena alkaliphila]|uniref:Uncharacterized protein n=1 Tax=Haloterrigena alkaliphila TaxID=2816475 RepID=A0A8A2VCQ5_9EURY|nr:hypothetical protein [Haloterrigena alkaliphila]QSW98500.1 hypothetical protein J0X25_14000 [Haloterrigena alkaliphila]